MTLLRELSRADFHAAFGWEHLRPQPLPAQHPDRHRRAEFGSYGIDGGDGSAAVPARSAGQASSLPAVAYRSSVDEGGGRGGESGSRGDGDGDGNDGSTPRFARGSGGDLVGHCPVREERHQQQQQVQQLSERPQDSATSGLGFMSALQRAVILEQQQHQEEEGTGSGVGGDEHALELLSTIAACCEVRSVY